MRMPKAKYMVMRWTCGHLEFSSSICSTNPILLVYNRLRRNQSLLGSGGKEQIADEPSPQLQLSLGSEKNKKEERRELY